MISYILWTENNLYYTLYKTMNHQKWHLEVPSQVVNSRNSFIFLKQFHLHTPIFPHASSLLDRKSRFLFNTNINMSQSNKCAYIHVQLLLRCLPRIHWLFNSRNFLCLLPQINAICGPAFQCSFHSELYQPEWNWLFSSSWSRTTLLILGQGAGLAWCTRLWLL